MNNNQTDPYGINFTGGLGTLLTMTFAFSSPTTTKLNEVENSSKKHSYLSQARAWESSIDGTQSTGATTLFQLDAEKYSTLEKFLKNFLSEQVDVPKEFEKTFQKDFWDILA